MANLCSEDDLTLIMRITRLLSGMITKLASILKSEQVPQIHEGLDQ